MVFPSDNNGCLCLKLLIEKKSQKLLFAEVSKDTVDFLISLVCLPIGSVAKLITEESVFFPLSNTYRSWMQLNSDLHLSSDLMTADRLIPAIDPRPSIYSSNFSCVLSSASPSTIKEKIYACKCKYNVDYMLPLNYCKSCHGWSKELSFQGCGVVTKEQIERDGYVKGGFTYAVLDDLSIVPMTPLTSIAFLNKMGHNDISLLEEKSVCLGVQKGLELLKTSLRSKTVLTDMFLTKKKEEQAKEAN